MSENNRIEWIDSAKGIGIFLVIIGHTPIHPMLRVNIFAFHIPLFFLLSGLLFSNRKPFKEFIKGKAKSLLIPYVAFSVISAIMVKLLINQPVPLLHFLKTMLISERNQIDYNLTLWFLTSLFVIELIFYFISKYLKNKYLVIVVSLLSGYLSFTYLGAQNALKVLPWSLDQSLLFLSFFGLGYFLKQSGFLRKDHKKSLGLILLSVAYIVLVFKGNVYTQVWERIHVPFDLGFFRYYIWAVAAIGFVLYISQYISVLNSLSFMGKNSLIFFTLHTSLAFSLYNRFIAVKLNPHIHDMNFLGLVISLFSIVILTPFVLMINNYVPFIIGKKKARNERAKEYNPGGQSVGH
jgi:fucose 4-O-acetylase-like acetyltransferase